MPPGLPTPLPLPYPPTSQLALLQRTQPETPLSLAHTRGESQLRRAGALEDDELGLEEDVAVDGEADAGVGLDATKASYR